jgi:hypothetical protein
VPSFAGDKFHGDDMAQSGDLPTIDESSGPGGTTKRKIISSNLLNLKVDRALGC